VEKRGFNWKALARHVQKKALKPSAVQTVARVRSKFACFILEWSIDLQPGLGYA
jgi:multisubunit Na+/H+ antiporter MnhE subunit